MSDGTMAGAAVVDITPPPGLMMCGYAARTEPALGVHDALTARALVVGDTALVVADVLGLHEESCARIRQRTGFGERLVVVATHTHGGPMSMPGRGGGDADPGFLRQLEDGCVAAVRRAAERRQPARLRAGNGADPGIAFNRRSDGGPIDPTVPVLRVETLDGTPLAVAFAHGCHPVVLGAGNRLYTADFPHFARAAIEAEFPDAVALFLPGCSGDVSTGHSPESSISTDTPPDRSFAEAERLGRALAASVLAASLVPLGSEIGARSQAVSLALERSERVAVLVVVLGDERSDGGGAREERVHVARARGELGGVDDAEVARIGGDQLQGRRRGVERDREAQLGFGEALRDHAEGRRRHLEANEALAGDELGAVQGGQLAQQRELVVGAVFEEQLLAPLGALLDAIEQRAVSLLGELTGRQQEVDRLPGSSCAGHGELQGAT